VLVFERAERFDLDPARHGEPYWSYLNRSARPEFSRARDQINQWFGRLCGDLRPGVRARLQNGDDHEFASACWELYLHEMFVRLGYDITCEPTLPSGRKIDFLVSLDGRSMYVEATIARSSAAERSAEKRLNRVYQELDQVQTNTFMLGITIENPGPGDMPNVARLRAGLEKWLAAMDPDAVESDYDATGAYPTFPWEAAGWKLRFEAYPKKPECRGERAARPLGIFMDDTGGRIDDETRLRRALNRKAPSQYGELDHPYVVAISEYAWEFGDHGWHRKNVLYGREAVEFGDGLPTRSVRQTDGYWRGPGQRPRNRRLAAVLFCAHLHPWQLDRAELEWWDNPFAERSVPKHLVPAIAHRHQLILRGSERTFRSDGPASSAATLFA
jgi:hypothetical protein